MTAPGHDVTIDARRAWIEAVPDTKTRPGWATAFDDPTMASKTIAATARTWREVIGHPGYAAYLHARGRQPSTRAEISQTFADGHDFFIRRLLLGGDTFHDVGRWAALTTHHPDLDHFAAALLARSSVTLDEADGLIAAGPLDRDTLTAMAGLR